MDESHDKEKEILTLSQAPEDFLNILTGSRTSAEMCSTKLFGFCLSDLDLDLPIVLKIALVADNNNWHLVSKLCPQLLHPFLHAMERIDISDVIDDDGT